MSSFQTSSWMTFRSICCCWSLSGDIKKEDNRGQNPPDIQFDVLSSLSVLVELFKRLAVWDNEEGLEGDLALSDEVCLGHGAVLVLGDGLTRHTRPALSRQASWSRWAWTRCKAPNPKWF
eukprot:TRINITY_DN7070_c0_g1_i7.p1 TRINITY_DN7070_c0_g1~~TRINITY_DN7070_c0_g1_i7.p1  ORF type:complete len:120 (+),score=24.65 TRINITY_DN7070_c0_g1_i7:657-1016(+)